MGAAVCVCMPQVECPLHPDAAPTPEGVVLGAEERDLRYFLDGCEVTEEQARRWGAQGRARVTRGGSGVVPEPLRQPNETRDQWLRPWLEMASTSLAAERAAHEGLRAAIAALLAERHYSWQPDDGPLRNVCVECGEQEPCHVRAALAAGVRGE